ncbi:MAG: ATP synthase F1 subunit gamma, partial [Phycisphaeraceae bacterium]
MAQLRELKGRIKAVGNIKRITKTMQMIATAKFQAAARRATATKPYTRKVAELVGELVAAASGQTSGDDASVGGGFDHPLLRAPDKKTGRELLLVITSNRGLCGAYNANVIRAITAHLREHPDVAPVLHVIGKKGLAYFRFTGKPVEKAHTHLGDKSTYTEIEALADEFMQRFIAGEFDAVRVVSMRFISNARQSPRVLTLLPIKPPEVPPPEVSAASRKPQAANVLYEFSPEPKELLAQLLPIAVKSQLFQAFNEAIVSEQIGRMVAMKAATDNADQMGRNLKRSFNRARQAMITTELTEIVSGAAA